MKIHNLNLLVGNGSAKIGGIIIPSRQYYSILTYDLSYNYDTRKLSFTYLLESFYKPNYLVLTHMNKLAQQIQIINKIRG